MKKIVLTGVHSTPALALLEKINSDQIKSGQWQVFYFASQTFQPSLLPKKVVLKKISSPKFQRYAILVSLLNFYKLPLGLYQSILYLKQIKPLIVVSFGGYVAIPVCLAAKLLNIPVIIHEQTFKAGLASRITALLADKVAISWPQSAEYFPKNKTVLTGNPIRKSLLETKPAASRLQPSIYITGGHQGSLAINRVINQSLPSLLGDYRLFHQFGLAQSSSDWKLQLQLADKLPSKLKSRYQLKQWFSTQELADILSQVQYVVSRAGINTITELAYLNRKAVLIPLPYTQKNEQLDNAEFLKKLGLAQIILQPDLNYLSLKLALKKLRSTKTLSTARLPRTLISQASDNLLDLINEVIRWS